MKALPKQIREEGKARLCPAFQLLPCSFLVPEPQLRLGAPGQMSGRHPSLLSSETLECNSINMIAFKVEIWKISGRKYSIQVQHKDVTFLNISCEWHSRVVWEEAEKNSTWTLYSSLTAFLSWHSLSPTLWNVKVRFPREAKKCCQETKISQHCLPRSSSSQLSTWQEQGMLGSFAC